MQKLIVAVFSALLLSVPAVASSNWQRPTSDGEIPADLCTNTDDTETAIRGAGLRPGGTLYHCATNSNTGDSPIIEVAQSATVTFDPDTGGTGGAARVYIVKCLEATKSVNHCSRVIMDSDGSGVIDTSDVAGSELDGDNGQTSANGRFVYNLRRGYYYFEYTTNPSAGEEAIVQLEGF